MKKVFAVFVLFSSLSFADYDYKTGNNYNTIGNTTYGSNANTGSTWQQTNNSNGSYNGIDSKGNYYNGDNKTGYYHNSGTGKTCTGKGANRVCY